MLYQKILGLIAAATLGLTLGCGGGETVEAPEEEAAEAVEFFEVDPATAATVKGKVAFEGEAPKMRPINMSAEPDCKKLHDAAVYPDSVEVNENGTLKNVFVWVKSGLEDKNFEVPKEDVKLDQEGCIYRPHVLGMQKRQNLRVSNSDPLTHNVHPLPKVNNEWNRSQSPGAPDIEYKRFARQEIMLAVKCNIHPWMRAYINVVDHPFFAVTGEDGMFEIQGLPPGTYTIEARHEQFGSKEMSVTLSESDSQEIDFSFSAT